MTGKHMAIALTSILLVSAGPPADVAENWKGRVPASFMDMRGYLPKGATPDSLLINPLPPAPGSAAQARDDAAAEAALKLRGTPRFAQATIDAELTGQDVADVFSCAAGFVISEATTPRLNALLRKSMPDLAFSVYPTKRKFMRPRPFMVNNAPTCTPQDEDRLRRDGSYPSGHSSLGYGWALILAEVVPDRAGQLVARGRAFADSRRVCNVHWLSDTEEGMIVASAAVARLHGEPTFLADLKRAKVEVAKARTKLPAPDCARENAAFGGWTLP